MKVIGIALLVAGVILFVYGLNASDSIGSDFSRFFAGKPTDKAVWLTVGGAAALVVGIVLTLFGRSGQPAL